MRRHLDKKSVKKDMVARGGLGGLILALAASGLLFAAPAAANFETVNTFEDPAGQTIPVRTGLAVNINGAGGVPAGTLYEGGNGATNGGIGVNRYNARGEFQSKFGIFSSFGLAVWQSTGCVFALKTNEVLVLSADGSKQITSFGGGGKASETIAESPEKIHFVNSGAGRIAVNAAGDVYVTDETAHFPESRVMVFEPETPGSCEHYVYAGQASDITAPTGLFPRQLVVDPTGNLYLVYGEEKIYEFAGAQPGAPSCEFNFPAGELEGLTVNPLDGKLFYYTEKDKEKRIHVLSPCNEEGKFVELKAEAIALTPKPQEGVWALAFNPALQWDPERPAGVLYAASLSRNLPEPNYIFALPVARKPVVESQSVSNLTSSSARLQAQINPRGSTTSYAFQYLTEAAYEANHPNEIQLLTIGASGGSLSLGLGGHSYGGAAKATLASGSPTAESLHTAEGTATLKAAKGTATLKAASGTGTAIQGSTALTAVVTKAGTFEVGQRISGKGILPETTILAIKAETSETAALTISQPASETGANISLSAGFSTLTAVTTEEGAFEVGQQVEGKGIPSSTTIIAVKAGELVLSNPANEPGTSVAINAGSKVLSAVSTSFGAFEVGQLIEGEGIPAGTTILEAESGALRISKPVSKPGTAVAISSSGPAPLVVGQSIEGPGIPPSTTITAVKAGQLTLSNPTTASGTVTVHAGLPFDASASQLRSALEYLPAIGAGNVKVSGGPGDEAGSNPYSIEYIGSLANTDVAEPSADSSQLTGGAASAEVQTENQGGGGFDEGVTEAPLGGAVLGGGQSPLPAAVGVVGLSPQTYYRYRVIATSHCNAADEAQVCEDAGPSKAFRTFPAEAPSLPDHRAYELVSPPQKHGGEVFPINPLISSCAQECKPGTLAERFPIQSSPDGEAVVYEGFPFSPEEGAPNVDEYVSRRTQTGWQTTNPTPALFQNSGGAGYKVFNSGLETGLLYQNEPPALSLEAPEGYPDLYLQPTDDPTSLSPLLREAPPNRTEGLGVTSLHLDYAIATADLSHVLVAANDALTPATAFAPEAVDGGPAKDNLYEWVEGQPRLVNVLPGNAETVPGAVFGSGTLLSKESSEPNGGGFDYSHAISDDGSRIFWSSESGQVYLRIDGEETIEIEDDVGKFLTASADGSKVLLSDGCLYKEVAAKVCEDLTQLKGGFKGIAGQSEDLSSIYFIDSAALTPEAEENANGEHAIGGKDNLYSWQEGELAFIATLGPEDKADWTAAPSKRTAEASPNGRYLAFISRAQLTGKDNTGPCSSKEGKIVPSPCPEAFLFDSGSGQLSCPSCNPSGELPLGPAHLPQFGLEPAARFMPQPRYLTNEGRLYFDTRDSLLPADTNNGVEDVYQYEPQGAGEEGTCKRAEGCVSLISAGTEPVDSNFLAIDEKGKNVFFTTRDQLVLKDTDDVIDLYDAREGGGIPSETETARGECQGEACQPLVSPPNDPTPGSSSFEGAGNVTEAKAKKKKHRHKHKRKHAKKHRRAKYNRGGPK
jgi:hypothetical protein